MAPLSANFQLMATHLTCKTCILLFCIAHYQVSYEYKMKFHPTLQEYIFDLQDQIGYNHLAASWCESVSQFSAQNEMRRKYDVKVRSASQVSSFMNLNQNQPIGDQDLYLLTNHRLVKWVFVHPMSVWVFDSVMHGQFEQWCL